jgi:peptide/nickel transport system permease protein
MLAYVVRRVLMMVPVIIGVFLLSFFLARVVPGNPALMMLGPQAPPSRLHAMEIQMGLNLPIWDQLWRYVWSALHGNFGTSIVTSDPVMVDLETRFPATVELTVASIVIGLAVAIPLGILSAVYRDSWIDWLGHLVSLTGVSMPTFWFGILLILAFFTLLRVAPPPLGDLGVAYSPPPTVTGMPVIDALIAGQWAVFWSALNQLILPAVTLSTGTIAIMVRMIRSSMLEVMEQDYVRTAHAKGVPPRRIYLLHVMKNALVPLITIFGLQLGYLLGGAVLVETVFSWPGVGSYVSSAILADDYAPVETFALLSAIFYSVINLLVDIINAAVDPRITYQ